MASILGVFLAAHARYNNRLVKEEARHAQEILTRIEQGQQETRKEVAEARTEMAEAFRRIEEGQSAARREMAEAFRKMDETLRRMDETLRRMDEGHRETIKYLADLIRSEGEKTRQAIRGTPA